MTYDQPHLLQLLSSEYALGTLRGRARQRFERLLAERLDAREHVAFWESRLGEFGEAITPVNPPARARDALLCAATARPDLPPISPFAATSIPAATPRLASGRRRSRRARRRYAAAIAAVLALAAAFWTGQYTSMGPAEGTDTAWMTAAGERNAPEVYLAQLTMPASRMGWLLSLSPGRDKLTIVAADDLLSVGRHSLQLWWISPTEGPLPLTLLPVERDGTAVIDLPLDIARDPQTVFVISLEPNGGSRSGKPSGPVLSTNARQHRT